MLKRLPQRVSCCLHCYENGKVDLPCLLKSYLLVYLFLKLFFFIKERQVPQDPGEFQTGHVEEMAPLILPTPLPLGMPSSCPKAGD